MSDIPAPIWADDAEVRLDNAAPDEPLGLYTGKQTSVVSLPVGHWTTIERAAMPDGKVVSSMLYVRLGYRLTDPSKPGYAEVRAVRPNGDSTAYDGIYLPAGSGARTVPVTRHWMGGRID